MLSSLWHRQKLFRVLVQHVPKSIWSLKRSIFAIADGNKQKMRSTTSKRWGRLRWKTCMLLSSDWFSAPMANFWTSIEEVKPSSVYNSASARNLKRLGIKKNDALDIELGKRFVAQSSEFKLLGMVGIIIPRSGCRWICIKGAVCCLWIVVLRSAVYPLVLASHVSNRSSSFPWAHSPGQSDLVSRGRHHYCCTQGCRCSTG